MPVNWAKRNWIGVVVIGALVASPIIAHHEADATGKVAAQHAIEAVADQLRENSVQNCERDNLRGIQINTRGVILRNYLNSAAAAREASAAAGHDVKINTEAAKLWRAWARQVKDVEIPNCEQVVPPLRVSVDGKGNPQVSVVSLR